MDIHFSRIEAETLIQAAEYALTHDPNCSVFYGEHRSAVRRAISKIEDYLRANPEVRAEENPGVKDELNLNPISVVEKS